MLETFFTIRQEQGGYGPVRGAALAYDATPSDARPSSLKPAFGVLLQVEIDQLQRYPPEHVQLFLHTCYRGLPTADFRKRHGELPGLFRLACYLDSPNFESWARTEIRSALASETACFEGMLDWLPRLEEMGLVEDQAMLLLKLTTLLTMEGRAPLEVGLCAAKLAGEERLSGVSAQALMGAMAVAATGRTPDVAMIQRLLREGLTYQPPPPSPHRFSWNVSSLSSNVICTQPCRLRGLKWQLKIYPKGIGGRRAKDPTMAMFLRYLPTDEAEEAEV